MQRWWPGFTAISFGKGISWQVMWNMNLKHEWLQNIVLNFDMIYHVFPTKSFTAGHYMRSIFEELHDSHSLEYAG